MANVLIRRSWRISEKHITLQEVFRNRRQFLKQMGFAGTGLLASTMAMRGGDGEPAKTGTPKGALPKKYPFARNPQYNPSCRLTDERIAGSYNNFYEFSLDKVRVKDLVGNFQTAPWPIQLGGLAEKPQSITAE